MGVLNWRKVAPENCKMENFNPERTFLKLLSSRGNVSTFWITEVIPKILGKKKL